MAKSKKSKGFNDPLDSIFGMIFSGAKSKPVKTKPMKYSGYNASKELAQSLAEIAGKPGNYVGDAALTGANEALNGINLVQMQWDTIDEDLRKGDANAGRLRLRGGDVGKFLTDPNKFINSAFEAAKNERKFARFLTLGRGMDSALLATWAKSQGFTSKEALELGMASSNWLSVEQKNTAIRKFNDNSVLSGLMNRGGGAPSDPKSIPKNVIKDVITKLDNTKGVDIIKTERDMRGLLSGIPGLSTRADFDDLVKELYERKKSSYGSWGGRAVEGSIGGRQGYIEMLQQDYNIRARFVDPSSPEYSRLMKAHSALDLVYKFKGPGFGPRSAKDAQVQFQSTLKNIDEDISFFTSKSDFTKVGELNKLKAKLNNEYQRNFGQNKYVARFSEILMPWGNPVNGDYSKYKNALFTELDYKIQKFKWLSASETDVTKKAEHEFNLATAIHKRDALRSLPGVEWRILLADIDGVRNTINANFLQGGLAASIIGGAFFNQEVSGFMAPGVNTPTQVRRFSTYKSGYLDSALKKLDDRLKEAGKLAASEFKDELIKSLNEQIAEMDKAYKDLRSWDTRVVLPRGDISEGYALLSYLNYLTPASIGRSLFYNAEGFIAAQHLRRGLFARMLNKTGKGELLYEQFGKGLMNDKDLGKLMNQIFLISAEGKFLQIDAAAFGSNYLSFMEALEGKGGKLGDLLKELNAFYKKDQTGGLARIIQALGAPSVVMTRLNKLYEVQFKNKVNRYLVDKVFRKFVGDTIANKLLVDGLAKLGIRQLIAATLTEVFAAVGSAFGPIGTFAGIVLAIAADAIATKIIQPFVKLFFAFLWSFMVVLIAFFVWIVILFAGVYPGPQQHIPPTDALECANGNPFKDLYKYQPVNAGNLPPYTGDSICPIKSPQMYCTQGDGPGVSDYHARDHGVDIGQTGLSDLVWYAPTNGRIVSFSADNYCLDGGKNYGGAMIFEGEGIQYRLLHVKALASGQVSKGTPVAITQLDLPTSACWTGPHFHLDVIVNGGFVDAEEWYKEKLKCNIISTGLGCG